MSKILIFEGCDGTGKTTTMGVVADKLRARGYSVECLQEPGTTDLGLEIRKIVKNPSIKIYSYSGLLLMTAARSSLVEERLRPILDRGTVDYVLIDRFVLSTFIYQGLLGNTEDIIFELNKSFIDLLSKYESCDLVFTADFDKVCDRLFSRESTSNDRFDADKSFLKDVCNSYLDDKYAEKYRGIIKRYIVDTNSDNWEFIQDNLVQDILDGKVFKND